MFYGNVGIDQNERNELVAILSAPLTACASFASVVVEGCELRSMMVFAHAGAVTYSTKYAE